MCRSVSHTKATVLCIKRTHISVCISAQWKQSYLYLICLYIFHNSEYSSQNRIVYVRSNTCTVYTNVIINVNVEFMKLVLVLHLCAHFHLLCTCIYEFSPNSSLAFAFAVISWLVPYKNEGKMNNYSDVCMWMRRADDCPQLELNETMRW